MEISISTLTFPFLLIGRLIGFVLGIITTLSIIGIALAGATDGFGWRREVLSSENIKEDMWRYYIRTVPGWYLWLFGSSTTTKKYFSNKRNNGQWFISDAKGKPLETSLSTAFIDMIVVFEAEEKKVSK